MEPSRDSVADDRAAELLDRARRSRRAAEAYLRRRVIDRVLCDADLTHRDRFAMLDRRMMPDRLRVPQPIAALLKLDRDA